MLEDDAVEEAIGVEAGKRKRSEYSFQWGPFAFIWRPGAVRTKPAWQVTCPIHAKPGNPLRCRRTRAFGTLGASHDCGDSRRMILSLKRWCVAFHPGIMPPELADTEHKHFPAKVLDEDDTLNEDVLVALLQEVVAGAGYFQQCIQK